RRGVSAQLLRSGFIRRHNADALWASPIPFCLTDVDLYTNQILCSECHSARVRECACRNAGNAGQAGAPAKSRIKLPCRRDRCGEGSGENCRYPSQPRIKHGTWLQEFARKFGRSERRWRDISSLIQPNLRVPRSNCAAQSDCESRSRGCRTTSATVPPDTGSACSLVSIRDDKR